MPNTAILLGASLSVVGATLFPLTVAQAALSDQETYDFVTTRYTLLLEETRSGCGYFA
jgi:hypothetical protein